jgi:hypothetical protein
MLAVGGGGGPPGSGSELQRTVPRTGIGMFIPPDGRWHAVQPAGHDGGQDRHAGTGGRAGWPDSGSAGAGKDGER